MTSKDLAQMLLIYRDKSISLKRSHLKHFRKTLFLFLGAVVFCGLGVVSEQKGDAILYAVGCGMCLGLLSAHHAILVNTRRMWPIVQQMLDWSIIERIAKKEDAEE